MPSHWNSTFRSLALTLLAFLFIAGLTLPLEATPRWVPIGPVGGVVRQLVQAASDPQRLYAATDPFGVFRSRDGGRSWQSIGHGLEGLDIQNLAVDPHHPEIVVANTSLGSPYNQIWRSEDGGGSWTPAVRPPTSPVGFTYPAYDLRFDTTSPLKVYAGTPGGIFRSEDGGSTWDLWALPDLITIALAQDPDAPAVWYASSFNVSRTMIGIYRSTDDGVTWTATAGAGGPGFTGQAQRLFFQGGALYAVWFGGLYRSTDGAASWSLVAHLPTLGGIDFALSPSGTIYAATFSGIYTSTDGTHWSPRETSSPERSSPRDSVVRLALVPGAEETVIAGGRRGIWRSTDSGRTWRAASHGLDGRAVRRLIALPNPQGTLLANFEDGLYRTDRAAVSWHRLPRPVGYESPFLAADPFRPGRVYALGTNVVGISDDLGSSFRTVGELPYDGVFLLLADPGHRNVLFASIERGFGSGATDFAFRSVDGGATWREIPSIDDLFDLAFDPRHPNLGFGVTSSGVAKTLDGGVSWTVLPPLEPTNVVAIPISVAFDPRTRAVYVGTTDRGVFRSRDGGQTFQRIVAGLPHATRPSLTPTVASLVLDGAGNLYAGLAGHGVFRLVPGHGWQAVNLDLPVATFSGTLVADPGFPGRLYAGTQGASVWRLEER